MRPRIRNNLPTGNIEVVASEPPEYTQYRELKDKLNSALQGSEESHSEFLTSLRSRVDGYLCGVSMRKEDREEVIQDVLLSVHLARHTYDLIHKSLTT